MRDCRQPCGSHWGARQHTRMLAEAWASRAVASGTNYWRKCTELGREA
uniref:Uncharacterized protein n=1 Tax=Arundo donax TaxID=35708 RepID=A0A0A9BPT2_ARUDO